MEEEVGQPASSGLPLVVWGQEGYRNSGSTIQEAATVRIEIISVRSPL